ncbi:MAG: hypothetical protein U0U67_12340 [Chitinophagales bacterium]
MPLNFDSVDIADINTAIAAGGRIWYNDCLDRLKTKIKNSFTTQDVSQCCYCARLFNGEFNMVIDIEHVLPQQSFPTERFIIPNLNIACKRCNMEIKKGDTSFIVNTAVMGTNYYQSHHYLFIHPNLDVYTRHIVLKTVRSGGLIFIKYILKDKHKAQYTYDYFLLKELEIDTINNAQGSRPSSNISATISNNLRRSFLSLLTRI